MTSMEEDTGKSDRKKHYDTVQKAIKDAMLEVDIPFGEEEDITLRLKKSLIEVMRIANTEYDLHSMLKGFLERAILEFVYELKDNPEHDVFKQVEEIEDLLKSLDVNA